MKRINGLLSSLSIFAFATAFGTACTRATSTPGSGASAADGGTDAPAGEDEAGDAAHDVPVDTGPGHILFRLPDERWHRMVAVKGSQPEDVTAALDAKSGGGDTALSMSIDGAWLALDTARFGCQTECVGIASVDGSTASLVPSNASPYSSAGRGAVASGGGVVVHPKATSSDRVDLFAAAKKGSVWGDDVNLTASSPKPYHHDVALSADGTKAVFDCGPSQYQDKGTCICEASTDGSAFRVVRCPEDGPGGSGDNELHHPSYAPDGSIVFEADWGSSEAVWRMNADGSDPRRLSGKKYEDDNSPCVLPDGRIVSLWLGRVLPDGSQPANHEIKIMNADGSNPEMVLVDVDVVDVGLTCGR